MKVGDKIPEVLGQDQDGNTITRESLKGQNVILYFYPKDNTSGCTGQACSLRDSWTELRDLGYTVIGVSKDSAKSHQGFREKHKLPFPLIADVDKKLLETFGVLAEKKMFGRTYMGTVRTTFLIDKEGVIRQIITGRNLKTMSHGEQLLKIIKKEQE